MPFVFKRLALLLSISACVAADKETPFRAGPAASYPSHQSNAQITIGAEPYVMLEKVKLAFGKVDPNQFGVLPVLIVIQNDSDKSIRLDRIKLEYVGGDRQHVDATPARDVRYLKGTDRPNVITGPMGKPKILKTKNPLNAWEIEGRAFSAQILPPGQSASGFFYFQAALQHGASVYINGLYEAGTGKEIFYFELPLQ
ncbi:MAG: hypothetical protein JWP63_2850 [Candidatus Solibacter sp.]|jgi:hypothetical protein|nr:hypothetical protein [Candidatus Solibacter sp.]